MSPVTSQLEKFWATFRPRRTDDLRDGAADWIGRTLQWQAVWIIEDGQFASQWACAALGERTPFAWVPEEDLVCHAPNCKCPVCK